MIDLDCDRWIVEEMKKIPIITIIIINDIIIIIISQLSAPANQRIPWRLFKISNIYIHTTLDTKTNNEQEQQKQQEQQRKKRFSSQNKNTKQTWLL